MLQQPAGNNPGSVAKACCERSASDIIASLKAVILMAGSVRPSKLHTSMGRALMQLPIDDQQTLIEHWQYHANHLAEALGIHQLPVRVMVDRNSQVPESPGDDERQVEFIIERDPLDYRGTGGVLHDLSADYDDDDYLLVVNGLQVMLQPLVEMTQLLASKGGDVSVIAHRDGTPSGLMLVRCGVLRAISSAGFVDMKEQALPAIARSHRVSVAEIEEPSALPVRTLNDYLYALRLHQLRLDNKPAVNDPFAENLESTFSIVEQGAKVDPSARIHDSVILQGGRVDAGAIVVRSLVCPGAVVGRGQRAVDRLVASPKRLREQQGTRS